nr:reverse transcriptase domain-containing protein [Tanacetum cinerariifolium]
IASVAIRGYPYMCFHSIGFRAKIFIIVYFLGSFAMFPSQWGSSKLPAWLKVGEKGHVRVWGRLEVIEYEKVQGVAVEKMYSKKVKIAEEFESDNLFHDHIQGEDENAEDVQMANHLRPMEELLRIPILGIKDAIVVPVVLADQFELKPGLLDFISNNPFFGLENDDPHSHIKRFYQIT